MALRRCARAFLTIIDDLVSSYADTSGPFDMSDLPGTSRSVAQASA